MNQKHPGFNNRHTLKEDVGDNDNDGFVVILKVCSHIPMPSPSPWPSPPKFNILPIIIDTMLNFNEDGYSDGDGIGMCKQTFKNESPTDSLRQR